MIVSTIHSTIRSLHVNDQAVNDQLQALNDPLSSTFNDPATKWRAEWTGFKGMMCQIELVWCDKVMPLRRLRGINWIDLICFDCVLTFGLALCSLCFWLCSSISTISTISQFSNSVTQFVDRLIERSEASMQFSLLSVLTVFLQCDFQ